MKINSTPLEGCLVIESAIYIDNRGHFQETYNQQKYEFLPSNTQFVQDNLSKSNINVLRGIHFQQTSPQGKLIRVVRGSIFDVAIDLRPNSKTFGKYFSINLTESNHIQLWIPEGFGHGFLSLEDETIVEYKCTNYYKPNDQQCIAWNDKDLNIKWPVNDNLVIVSKKDSKGVKFSSIKNAYLSK